MRRFISVIAILMFVVGVTQAQRAKKRITISGYVFEKSSKESLIGVNVYCPELKVGTTTNLYGFYSLSLPIEDNGHTIRWSYSGFSLEEQKIVLNKDYEIDVYLDNLVVLEEVEITSTSIERVSDNNRMSVMTLNPVDVKNIPALLGEKDVFKSLQLMPGVSAGTEGSSGLYIRGGGSDQNLVILDEATVYNANHLFGFFSIFNGDAIKSIELTKGGFPARYGGRLSSVVEISMKEGNKHKFGGEAGIGLLSSRLMLEGPIIKDKSSFLVSGRRTYLDILAQPFMYLANAAATGGDYKNRFGYFFYDFNVKANYEINNKNKIYVSGYFGRDKFYNSESTNNEFQGDRNNKYGLFWQNITTTLRWNHLFNNKLFANTSVIYSDYTFSLFLSESYKQHENFHKFKMNYISGINDVGLKYDLYYIPTPNHTIRAGIISTAHNFSPGGIITKRAGNIDVDDFPEFNLAPREKYQGIESAIYFEDDIKLFDNRLKINPGIRGTSFAVKNKTYWNIEPRLSASFMISSDLSYKASYAKMSQFLHLLSNTGIGLPTDLWLPSTDKIAPQESWQVATGFGKDFLEHDISLTLEGYYKESSNIIQYKEGASFIDLDGPEDMQASTKEFNWEKNVTSGNGQAYGVELLLKKHSGKFTGWIGYTLSWIHLQFDELNNGMVFYPRYDRRHDISIVSSYEITPKVTLSATWVYGTGNAVSLPKAVYTPITFPLINGDESLESNQIYYWNNSHVNDYDKKNSFRMSAYHRLDVGVQFHRKFYGMNSIFEISAYNLYNRKNPFFYYTSSEPEFDYNRKYIGDRTVLKQVSLFPILPSISWSLKF